MPIRSNVLVLAAGVLVLAAVVIARLGLTVRAHAELLRTRELALTDELTGLPNRRLFAERLQAELSDDAAALAVAMVDLDRFKELNDTLGHHAGDVLLAQLGGRLDEAVGEAGVVARLGGDEFALLLPGAGTGWSCTSRSTSPCRTCSTCARRRRWTSCSPGTTFPRRR